MYSFVKTKFLKSQKRVWPDFVAGLCHCEPALGGRGNLKLLWPEIASVVPMYIGTPSQWQRRITSCHNYCYTMPQKLVTHSKATLCYFVCVHSYMCGTIIHSRPSRFKLFIIIGYEFVVYELKTRLVERWSGSLSEKIKGLSAISNSKLFWLVIYVSAMACFRYIWRKTIVAIRA